MKGLNTSQRKAVTQPLHSITRVIAGPGSGKTRVLTCRIAYLIHHHHSQEEDKVENHNDDKSTSISNTYTSPQRILAVTFTKKAAMEMTQRLEELLKETKEHCHEQQQQQQYDVQDEVLDENLILQEEINNGRPNISSKMDRVTLGTFHSVCAKILRWNGSLLLTLPSISNFINERYYHDLNLMIEDKDKKSDDDTAKQNLSTEMILDGSFAIIDQTEQKRIVKQCLSYFKINLSLLSDKGRQKEIRIMDVLNFLGRLKSNNDLQDTSTSNMNDKGDKISELEKISRQIYPLYRKTLLQQNALDFDDLILLARELLIANPDVRHRLHQRWEHVLVDEFQDTSKAQFDLVKLLSSDSLLIVGDGDQSIYSWRGAKPNSMVDFIHEFRERTHLGRGASMESNYKNQNIDTINLMENYRSTSNIVRAAQKVISDNDNNKQSSRKDTKPIRGKGPPPRVLACSDAETEASFVIKTILSMQEKGELQSTSTLAILYRTNAQSRALEEECVKQNLQYLVRGTAGTFYTRIEIKDSICFLKWLYNSQDRNAMIRAFKTPRRNIGDVSIKEFETYCYAIRKHHKDNHPKKPLPTILDVLISLGEIDDDSAYKENSGFTEGIDHTTSQGIMSKSTLNKMVAFSKLMKTLKEKAEVESVTDLLSSVMTIFGLKEHFKKISKTNDEYEDRWANVMELCLMAERYSEDGPCFIQSNKSARDNEGDAGGSWEETPLGNFLDDISLLTDVQEDSSGDECENNVRLVANLMTIHASKGMEFDAVFIVGNEDGTFPTNRSILKGNDSIELEEERRLCYVAMTRAKTHLIMTWRKSVIIFTSLKPRNIEAKRSRFLDALVSKKTMSTVEKRRSKSSNIRAYPKQTTNAQPKLKSPRYPGEKRAPKSKSFSNASNPNMVYNKSIDVRRRSWDDWKPSEEKRLSMSLQPRPVIKGQVGIKGQIRKSSRSTTSMGALYSPNPNNMQKIPHTIKHRMDKRISNPSNLAPGIRSSRKIEDNRSRRSIQTQKMSPIRKNNPGSNDTSDLLSSTNHSYRNPEGPPSDMDSTMFHPVGSHVIHSLHGKGKVIPPPKPSTPDSMLVSIKFDSGMEVDFSVGDSSLRFVY